MHIQLAKMTCSQRGHGCERGYHILKHHDPIWRPTSGSRVVSHKQQQFSAKHNQQGIMAKCRMIEHNLQTWVVLLTVTNLSHVKGKIGTILQKNPQNNICALSFHKNICKHVDINGLSTVVIPVKTVKTM